MSKVPAEVEFLETLLEKADGAEISAALEENKDKVTDEFKKLLDSLVDQLGNAPNQQPELVEKLKLVQKIVKL
jgi:hypothetical protein